MNATKQFKRVISALLVLVMLLALVPASVFAAEAKPVDAVIMFSDLHTKKSNYKESNVKNIMTAFKNAGLPVSSVVSCGDAFSVNEDSSSSNGPYTGYTATITGYIQNVLGNLPVNYLWSDHDRYAVKADGSSLLDKKSQLVYGAGNDGVYGTSDDGNYYVYFLSMGDLCSYDRYKAGFNYTATSNNRASKGFTPTVEQAIANFQADAAKLDKSKPLLIASHQPLFDNRNDNAWAEDWFDAINEVAEEMDVAFFFGHNHKYDTAKDYYYAKGSTMPVATQTTTNGTWNYNYETGVGYKPSIDLKAENKVLNFTHLCAGYLEPTSTGSYSSSTTRLGTAVAVTIYEDSIQYTTYNANGVYTGNFAVNVNVKRDHAKAEVVEPETTAPETTAPETTVPETTVPETTVPETTEPKPTEPVVPETSEPATDPTVPEIPEEPEVSGTIWRKATTIESGKKYLLVNYGYNASGVDTYAVNSAASATAVTVKSDDKGAYIVNDDQALAWTASTSGSQFLMANADTGYYLRAANYVYGTSGSNISVNKSVNNGSTYTSWSLETKNGSQVLAVRRSGSGNYYPVRYTGSKFQAFNSAQVGSMTNWMAVFVETEENAHQHSFETVTVAATCTKDGSVTTTCTGCGQQTVEVLKATGHSYTVTETAATCSKDGSKVYTCACGDTYTEAIPATGNHTYETTTVEATCESAGSVTKICSVCGDTKVEAIPAKGHSYTAKVTAPTCTEAGYTTYTCNCGASYVADEVAAKGHSYTAKTKAATCTEAGAIVYTCVCGDTYTEVVPATGHSYTAKVTAPTCTEAGYTTYTCACGDSYTADEVAAKGHSYTAKVTAPTCTEAGYTTYTCACGDSYTANEVAAKGHSYTAKVTEPTCTEEGATVYTCACGDSYTADEVAAKGHSYTAKVTEPTCTEEGATVYTCACGYSYSEKIAALGHKYESVVTAPTCETVGYTTYTCSVCDHTYTGNQTAALGHSYTAEEVDGFMVYTCHCGHSYSEKIENLTYTKVSSIAADNAYVITLYSNKKYYALSHENNKISAVQVTVSNNQITSEITDDMVWEYSNKKLSYEANGEIHYLYAQSSGWWGWGTPTLTLSTSNSTDISFSNNKVKMSNYYLRYSNGSVSLNRSATTTYFFVEE